MRALNRQQQSAIGMEGARARKQGVSREKCPYRMYPTQQACWLAGWRRQHNLMQKQQSDGRQAGTDAAIRKITGAGLSCRVTHGGPARKPGRRTKLTAREVSDQLGSEVRIQLAGRKVTEQERGEP